MNIEKSMLCIEDLVIDCEKYYAHIRPESSETNTVKKELLADHTKLCQKYWINIVRKKNLDKVLENFENLYFKDFDKEALELFELMTANIVTFHDMGKVNPKFQKGKMNNNKKIDEVPDDSIGSKHSIISSAFYLDYFLKQINDAANLKKNERSLLTDFTYIYSFIISRHHGDLSSFQSYFESLSIENEIGEAALRWIEIWKMNVLGESKHLNVLKSMSKMNSRLRKNQDEYEKVVYLYALTRLLYSLLVAADYYATTEYMKGIELVDFGELNSYEELSKIYDGMDVQKSIREYEVTKYPKSKDEWDKEDDINVLRTEMFLDSEKTLKQNLDKSIFYLEAPTGSGKSNAAMNLSLTLMKEVDNINKIFYIYPFNTLVEQNMETLENVFGNHEQVLSQIAVINSLVPMKKKEENECWDTILLDRQFFNYPIILSTHVMLFRTLFGDAKEDLFGFHQLCGSVIVLDEIQSYKNDLWSAIIVFLQGFAKLLNLKVIIMSATLPNLDFFTKKKGNTVELIENREKYFCHKTFAERVVADYSLLDEKIDITELKEHILNHSNNKSKILVEFIKKARAEEFYNMIKLESETPVLLMTGDSSIEVRKNMISRIKASEAVILVATQVIEAGIDIDIGYKDISKLDSEEQFMGRINRSSKKSGIVYFFDIDDAAEIYENDVRVEKKKTLHNKKIRDVLLFKNFQKFYENEILPILRLKDSKLNDKNLKHFFDETVGNLDMPAVAAKMKLIDDNRQYKSVFLARRITDTDGNVIDGNELWEEYKDLLENSEMNYSQRKVCLHDIRCKMNNFIYQVSKKTILQEDEQVGDIYYIEDGNRYFDENGNIVRELFENNSDLFY